MWTYWVLRQRGWFKNDSGWEHGATEGREAEARIVAAERSRVARQAARRLCEPARGRQGATADADAAGRAQDLRGARGLDLDGRRALPDREREFCAACVCSKCGRAPATACRHCGVRLCELCGEQHDPPDCPPQWKAYMQAVAGQTVETQP